MALETIKTIQFRVFALIGTLLLIMVGLLMLLLGRLSHHTLIPSFPALATLLMLPLVFYVQRRVLSYLFSKTLECGPDTLTLYRHDQLIKIARYEQVWFCDTALIIDGLHLLRTVSVKDLRTLKMVVNHIWPAALINEVLRPKLPPAQVFHSKFDLARALFRTRPSLALQLLAQEIAVGAMLLLAVGLMLSTLHLQLFHPGIR